MGKPFRCKLGLHAQPDDFDKDKWRVYICTKCGERLYYTDYYGGAKA